MPVFETAPFVFDIGTAYTKLGFASDSYPRFIIPTENYDINTGASSKLFNNDIAKDSPIFYEQMVDFVQSIFFKHLLVSPKERKIVIVESVLCPTQIRETLAKVLFRHFEVLSVLFVPTHLVSLSTLAIDTALVIDIGFKEAIVMPVFSGVQVLHAWQAQPLAADAVHTEIKRQLIENGISQNLLTNDVIEDIKVRTCFVTNYERAQSFKSDTKSAFEPCPDVLYPINGKDSINISGRLRETAFEVLFPDDNDCQSLPHIILDSILKCPIDMRRPLAENIFLIGGTSMALGLLARLKHELLVLLSSNIYKDNLFIEQVKFHMAPSKENFTSWLGGSIYGGTDLIKVQALTKDSYAKSCRVPDWVNLDDNRLPGSN